MPHLSTEEHVYLCIIILKSFISFISAFYFEDFLFSIFPLKGELTTCFCTNYAQNEGEKQL